MKYIIACLLLICSYVQVNAQEQDQEHNKKPILLDTISLNDLKQDEDFVWAAKVKNDDKYNSKVLKRLANYNITVILGTWCSDSHVAVAQFTNYLTHIGYDINQVTFIGLDEDKKSPTMLHEKLDITFVPTFLFKHKKDASRSPVKIVEYLPENLASHLLETL